MPQDGSWKRKRPLNPSSTNTVWNQRVLYRMTDGFDSYLIPSVVIDTMDHDLYEIRYEDPFLKERDGTPIVVQKFVNGKDLVLPGEYF